MGRHNGSWAKFHPQMNDHAKTRAAVRVLVDAGIPEEFAGPIIVAAVPRLAAWALSDGDSGRTGGLSDARFIVEAWPESSGTRKWGKSSMAGALLRRALHAAPNGHECGYLEGEGEAEVIHDFAEVYADVLSHRERNRKRHEGRRNGDDSPPGAARSPARSLPAACAQPAGSLRTPARASGSGSGSGSGSDSGRGGVEPPPGVASRPADPDPDREAAEAIADALNEDLDLVRQVLRELALKGIPANRAAQIALELPGPIGAWDFKAHALKVAQPPKPAAPDHGARPPSDGRGLAASRDQAADAERIRAEFAASGYVDRNAWNADRRAGQIRTGPAAATRRFDVGTMSAVDVAPDAVGA